MKREAKSRSNQSDGAEQRPDKGDSLSRPNSDVVDPKFDLNGDSSDHVTLNLASTGLL